jgi:hypothetical protein
MYAGLTESTDRSGVENVITKALPKLFDFDFPIFDENYRTTLEKKIVRHYYTRELGYETVGLWKLKLQAKLQEIMPYYNKLYESELLTMNPLYTTDLYRKKDNETKNNNTNHSTRGHDFTIDDTGHDNPNETTYNLHSDTPQGGLDGVETGEYLSDAEKTTRTGASTNSNHRTELGENTTDATESGTRVDDYLEHVYGYSGYNPSKLLKEYRETFLNIDMMIIKDLNKLFIGLW